MRTTLAGAIVMLGSPLCLTAYSLAPGDTTYGGICVLFAGAHFIAGLIVILAGIFSERGKPNE